MPIILSDQQENKSRLQPHLLFYQNVSVRLIVPTYTYHICILVIHSCFIDCLPLKKFIIN
jgi:hypothetical protein